MFSNEIKNYMNKTLITSAELSINYKNVPK